MRPRTVAIAILTMLLIAIGLRVLVVRYNLLPISEEAVLRHAVGLTVNYQVGAVNKKLYIHDPAELNDLLAALKIRPDEYGYYVKPIGDLYPVNAPTIEFLFPNGKAQNHTMNEQNRLGQYVIDPAFHNKLCEIVSRHEKMRIENLIPPRGPPVLRGDMDKGCEGINKCDHKKVLDGK